MLKFSRGLIALLLLLFITSPVYAAGIGMFFNGTEIDAEWDGDTSRVETEGRHRDYGFSLDSNLASNRLFNYRMELGRSDWKIDSFNASGVKAELEGVVMNHDFGFGGLLTPNLRLWFGPEVRVTLLEGNLDGVSARDLDLFGLGYGAAIGLNFNLPNRMTLAAKGGFLKMDYYGRGPELNGTIWNSSHYDVEEDLVYVGLSIFFRTLDR